MFKKIIHKPQALRNNRVAAVMVVAVVVVFAVVFIEEVSDGTYKNVRSLPFG